MAEMKDSGIEWCGMVPEDWNVVPNKYVMYKKKDLCTKYNGEDILSLTMEGVIVRDLDAGGKMPATFDGYQIIHPNNLLMCLFDYDVTPRCIGLIKNEGLTSPAYSQFILKNGNVAKYYYYYYLMIDNTKELLHLAKNLRHSFTEEQLGAINTPVPPIEIQKRIADFLDKKCGEIDNLYSTIEKQIETLEEYKKSVIREAVTRGLNPNVEMKDSGVEWIGNIPVHWKVKKIKYSATLTRGVFGHRPRNDPKYYDGDYPFIQTGDVASANKYIETFSQTLSELGKSVSKEFKKGTIAFTLAANVGDAAILDFDSYFPDSVMAIIPNKNINNVYLYYILSVMKTEFLKVAIVNTQMNLNVERVGNVYIPITFNDSEQREIVNYLDLKCTEIDGAITDKKQQLETIEQYKKSLIYEYVTGKKEVR
jgi:type I restriction enzyme S subunit